MGYRAAVAMLLIVFSSSVFLSGSQGALSLTKTIVRTITNTQTATQTHNLTITTTTIVTTPIQPGPISTVTSSQTVTSTTTTTSTTTVPPNIQILLSPTSGPGNTSISIAGRGFDSNALITITGTNKGGAIVFSRSNAILTRFDGTLSLPFLIPGLAAGTYTLTAAESSGKNAIAIFTITPFVTLSPNPGLPGTAVTVVGTGFGIEEMVTVSGFGSRLGANATNANGAFSLTFKVPNVAAGAYSVTATGGTSGLVFTTTFTVT